MERFHPTFVTRNRTGARQLIMAPPSTRMRRTSIGCPGRITTPAAVGLNANGKVAVGDGSSVFINKVNRGVVGGAIAGAGDTTSGNITSGTEFLGRGDAGNLVDGDIIEAREPTPTLVRRTT
jgi:hypothetical protein